MLKNLKKLLDYRKDNSISDIIVYGSSVKGKFKPNDVDIVVIFSEGTLKERLEKIQNMKSVLDMKNLDMKQMLMSDFFSDAFLAKTGIILEGYSIFNDNYQLYR